MSYLRFFILLTLLTFAVPSLSAQTDDIYATLDEANDLAINGNPRQAIKLYDEVLSIDKNNVEALYFGGLSHLYLENYTQAVSYFEKAERLMPDNGDIYLHKSTALMSLKQYDKAVIAYTKALEFFPNNDELYSKRSIAFMILNQKEKAHNDAKKALQLNPQNKVALEINEFFKNQSSKK